ncbi:YiaA/YiaB family inner membrane protein [Pseudonocardia sp.]|uniref:YiaA/YiaB family inner membrane protein n=1 Tax=Pseudonocardia sp. TaxID=60912 RepID=UPI0026019F9C|nr:YiaA/YiaB family inner membrane protein [Pseudonocardia sp.]
MTTNPPPASPTTAAFHVQAILSFAVALCAVTVAVIYLPADPWVRAFLALGVLYVTTSAFTLAKTIRDRQEITTVVTRVDQARVDKLLAEHDPYAIR